MSLADRLAAQPTADEAKHVARTEFDGARGFIQTASLTEAPKDHENLLRQFGYDPTEVRIVGSPHVSRWQQRARDKDTGEFETVWLGAYKFTIEERATGSLDLDELITDVAKWKPKSVKPIAGDGVFVFQASDLQLGKIDGDGLAGTLDRYLASVERAVEELKAQRKRHGISAIHLIFAGDCIENGGVSQGGKLAWRQSLTVTEQVRVWRRLLLSTIKSFEAYAPVTVSVCGGNHDDATRMPVQTRADDNWATEGAIAVADTLAEVGSYDHVTVQVPPRDQAYMTVGVNDSIFTIAHGHQWRKGKAADWWASQAFYQGNPAGSHLLCHGHWHSTSVHQDGPRTIICSPTFDGGSAWFRDLTGAESRQGGLVYVTHGPEFYGLSRV